MTFITGDEVICVDSRAVDGSGPAYPPLVLGAAYRVEALDAGCACYGLIRVNINYDLGVRFVCPTCLGELKLGHFAWRFVKAPPAGTADQERELAEVLNKAIDV